MSTNVNSITRLPALVETLPSISIPTGSSLLSRVFRHPCLVPALLFHRTPAERFWQSCLASPSFCTSIMPLGLPSQNPVRACLGLLVWSLVRPSLTCCAPQPSCMRTRYPTISSTCTPTIRNIELLLLHANNVPSFCPALPCPDPT